MDDYYFSDVAGLFSDAGGFITDSVAYGSDALTDILNWSAGTASNVVNTANKVVAGVENVKNAFDSSTPTDTGASAIAQAVSSAVKSSPVLKWSLIVGGGALALLIVKKLVA